MSVVLDLRGLECRVMTWPHERVGQAMRLCPWVREVHTHQGKGQIVDTRMSCDKEVGFFSCFCLSFCSHFFSSDCGLLM